MADEKIGEAAEAVAAEGGIVVLAPNPEAEAAEREPEPEPAPAPTLYPEVAACCPHCDEHRRRIEMLEARLDEHADTDLALRADVDARALAAHEHQTDEDVRIVADELRALREEEVAPRRGRIQRGWLRRIGRGERSA